MGIEFLEMPITGLVSLAAFLVASCMVSCGHSLKVQDRPLTPRQFDESLGTFLETWGRACCDECFSSCKPTKALMSKFADMVHIDFDKSIRTLNSWLGFLENTQREYESVAHVFLIVN